MNKTIIASLIALTYSASISAAQQLDLNEVVVTATRTAQSKDALTADVTVIDREEIERAGMGSLSNLLSRQPGVQISTNGGVGNNSSVFLRGTSSEQIVVLVDGMRINSATLGTTAFQNLPLAQIERIEILRGPASSLYGADAVGGVIQIFTKKVASGKAQFNAAMGLGGYNTKTAEAGVRGNTGSTQYGIQLSSYDTDSFSAIDTSNNTTSVQDDDDDGYRNLSLNAHLSHTIADGHSLGIQFFQSQGKNHFDGFGGTGDFNNRADQTLQSYALTSKNQLTGYWHSTLRLGEGVDKSDSTSAFGTSHFKTTQTQLTWQHDFTLPLGELTFAYDKLDQRVNSSNDYASTKRSNDAFLLNYHLNKFGHSVNASLREDHNSQFGNYITGGLGYAYRFNAAWKVSASYGSAFRSPTFNQLYFPSFGNPDLAPEESDALEASIKYQGQRFDIGATVFNNKVRNLLANVGPAAGTCTFAGFCPTNIGKVEINGITLDGRWDILDNWLLSGHFTVQSPRVKEQGDTVKDQLLVRRGNRYGTVNLVNQLDAFSWGAELTGASARYNNLANTKRMSGYVLFNLTANYQINDEWQLQARANNVFDKDYVLAFTGNGATSPAYNTAGSNVFVTLRYDMAP